MTNGAAAQARELTTGTASALLGGMILFFTRFMGVLVLDSGTFEEIEADRHSAMQSVVVVLLVCLAGGVAALGLGLAGAEGFITGAVVSLGAWLVWAAAITTIGTVALAEPATKSDLTEVLRVLGFAAAPGVFIAFAAMRAIAGPTLMLVVVWTIAAAVIGVRQALDYRSTTRAIGVCVVAWLLSFGVVWSALMLFSTNVS
jgi:Yip1 domain